MAEYSEETDRVKRVKIFPEITRVFWSCRRAWHGNVVKLHIETHHIPNDTPVFVEIWEEDSAEGSPDDFIIKLDKDYKIQNEKCTIDYKIEWDKMNIGDDLMLEGEDLEFYFLVIIEAFGLRKKSDLLYVDLASFRFSS